MMDRVFRNIMDVWDRLTLLNLLKVLVVTLILSLGLNTYSAVEIRGHTYSLTDIAENNEKTLRIIEAQTSPEAAARQKAQVEDIIGIIDCNQRQALQDALQGLVDRGILSPQDVVTITRACELQTTTTTTVPETTTTILED